MFVAISILSTLILSISSWYILKFILWVIRVSKITKNIPGASSWSIIQDIPLYARINSLEDIFHLVLTEYQKYNAMKTGITKVWIGPKFIIALNNPKYIETILSHSDSLNKDPIYRYMGLTANGAFVTNGHAWQELRKPIDNFITKKMIESNRKMFHEKSLKLCDVFEKFAESGQYFNLRHYTTNACVDAASGAIFGYDLNEVENDQYNLAEALDRTLEITWNMMVKVPYSISFPFAKISRQGKRLKKVSKIFWDFTNKLMDGRTANKKMTEEENGGKQYFFSDILLEKAKSATLSVDETGRLASDVFIGAIDTPAGITAYALLMLAMNPVHQQAVYQEQLDIVGKDPSKEPSWEQLSMMTYLTRVVQETLRMYSPPVILRTATNDIELGEHKVPSGSTILVLFYFLHRDPTLWSHPDQFYPDHFLPAEVEARPKNCYYPFSSGPRVCPGNVYAMAYMKIFLSTMIRKYKFETQLKFHELKYKLGLLLDLRQKFLVKVTPRN